jgi:hypothetical protein
VQQAAKAQKMTDVIRFPAEIIKIQTMQDGAIRVTVDLPETMIDVASDLMKVKRAGGTLEIAAVPVKND